MHFALFFIISVANVVFIAISPYSIVGCNLSLSFAENKDLHRVGLKVCFD